MKSHKLIAKFMIAAFVACIVGACTDLAKIEDRLDDLDSKVTALQAQISALNNNVETFKYLKDGAVITEIQEVAGGYELTLSDGRTLTVNHGENGTSGNTPTISINENGYWVINGVVQTVNAYGQNGVTPKFSVDADGYWVVSYNNGTSYERVKDADGNPVKAKVEITNGTPVEADSFFSSVEVKDNLLVLTLRADGTEVEVPIVKGFKFVISKNGNLVEGVQKIQYGTTVTFDVEQAGVASAAIVACPAGFEVELTETTLSVKAPAKDSEDKDNENIFIDINENNDNYYITKASASLSKDLAILVVSNKGLSILSKIQLEATEPQPEASLSNSTHECYSFNSVKLNATVVNGDRVHRVIKAASEPAVTAEDLLNTIGISALDGTVTLSETNLAPSTEYVAYYLASDGTKHGDVQRFEFSTRAVDENNLYEKYATGETITVAGLEINNINYPEALYICRGTTTRGISKNGLIFVESHPDIVANLDSADGSLVVVGTNPSIRAKVQRAGYAYISASSTTEYWIIQNISLNCNTPNNTYTFQLNGNGTCEKLAIVNCHVNVPYDGTDKDATQFIYANNSNTVKEVLIKDSEFLMEKSSANNLFNFGATQTVDEITIENNVFYSTNVTEPTTGFVLISAGNTTAKELKLNRNTFYGAFLATGNITNCKSTNATVTYNLFGLRSDATANVFVIGGKISGTMNIDNNAYYKNNASKGILAVGNSNLGTGTNNSISSVGISTDNWKPAEGKYTLHASYGAIR